MSDGLEGHCGGMALNRPDVVMSICPRGGGSKNATTIIKNNNNNDHQCDLDNFPLLNKSSNDERAMKGSFLKKTEMKTNVRLSEPAFLPSRNLGSDHNVKEKVEMLDDVSLPQVFTVKYLGKCDASGLWGIKHTRKPVDYMVAEARKIKTGFTLPYLKLTVSEEGVDITALPQNKNEDYESGLFPIHMISYGVQDLVYTRVFAMIVVRETNNVKETHPFECHGFVCDSRQTARQLTFSLANAFKVFSESMKAQEFKKKTKKFAIDLRTPEEMQEIEQQQVEDDSEV